MPTEKVPRVAYVVDLDDNGKPVRGTVRSALKEKPQVSQRDSRSSKTKKSHSDTGDKSSKYSQAVEVIAEKEKKLERRKSTTAGTSSPRKSASRPPLSHENRASSKNLMPSQRSPRDVPSHYGIPPQTYAPPVSTQLPPMQIPMRPRAITTQTYPYQVAPYQHAYTSTGAHGPPLSASAYYPHAPAITPSYPPPSTNTSYMMYAAPQTLSSTPQTDYFAQQMAQPPPRPLSARFETIPRSNALDRLAEPIARTTSAFGTRETRRPSMDGQFEDGYYEDSYASRVSDGAVRRRDSIRAPVVRMKEEEDARAMPPPPLPPARAGILRRPAPEEPAEPEYDERHERHERSHRRENPRPRRPSTNRHSVSYDLGKDSDRVRVETANNGRRRQSYYGQSVSMGAGSGAAAANGYEEKLTQAANYQADVTGPTIPLTAEVLKRQQRRQGGSSRSTSSRDESDYRKSQTTRTTRSSSGDTDENVTIKVVGQARVMVGGAQIDYNDGGEISISRQKSIRNGSERGSEFGGQRQIDDRKSRVERPTGQSRISSTRSYTRSSPHYQMENYL